MVNLFVPFTLAGPCAAGSKGMGIDPHRAHAELDAPFAQANGHLVNLGVIGHRRREWSRSGRRMLNPLRHTPLRRPAPAVARTAAGGRNRPDKSGSRDRSRGRCPSDAARRTRCRACGARLAPVGSCFRVCLHHHFRCDAARGRTEGQTVTTSPTLCPAHTSPRCDPTPPATGSDRSSPHHEWFPPTYPPLPRPRR